MKRILFIIIILTGISPLFSQTLTFEGVKRSLQKSDETIKNEKKKADPKTWFDRGVLFHNAAEVNTQFLRQGMPVAELKLFMRNPVSTETVETKEGQREVYNYERVKVFFQEGLIVDWKETEAVHPNPLPEAFACYKKAAELDAKGKYTKQIKENLQKLNNLILNKAIQAYQEEDYNESYRFFEHSIKLVELPVLSDLPADTALYYNTGLVASFAKKHKEALKYYEKARSMDYGGGTLFVLIKDQYIALGDSANAGKVLMDGFQKFPKDNSLVIEIVNYYITSEKSLEALNYLNIAKELEPNNSSLYFAEGFLYEKMDNPEKALQSYLKALEIKPDYYDALYNTGVLYYNRAVKEFEKANEIMDNKAYQIACDAAMATLRKAVPYMERAHEVNPKDKFTLENLKTVYYRLQMTDKLKEVEEKLSKME